MDGETLRKDFEEWAERCLYGMRSNWFERSISGEYKEWRTQDAWLTWLESARRADRRAREECITICETLMEAYANDPEHTAQMQGYLVAACDDLSKAIRATIPEKTDDI